MLDAARGRDEFGIRGRAAKVLCFVETPHRLTGAQRSLLAVLPRLPDFGFQPSAVFPAEGTVSEAFRSAGLDVRILPAPQRLLEFGSRWLKAGLKSQAQLLLFDHVPYAARLARLVRAERFDVLHFNQPRGILSVGLAGQLSRRPSVLHVRGAPDVIGWKAWLAAQVLASRIILVSKALESSVAGPMRKRAQVVHNGVDLPRGQPDRALARAEVSERYLGGQLEAEEFLVLSLSSITPFKGLHHLMSAAALLRRSGVRLRVLHAGGAEHPAYVRHLADLRRRLDLGSSFTLAGFVGDPGALLRAADTLVLPSVDRERLELEPGCVVDVVGWEGLPRTILEAMAHSLPVVASGVQGVPEQIEDGVTGLLVPPGDPELLAGALRRVAGDRGLREAMGRSARLRVERLFSVEASARGLARVLADSAA